MTRSVTIAGCAVLALLPPPLAAQAMPGMKMDMPMPKPANPEPAKVARKPVATPHRVHSVASPAKVVAQSPTVSGEGAASITPDIATGPRPSPGSQVEKTQEEAMPGMAMPAPGSNHAMPMTMAATGTAYAEGSGTARNPGADGAMHGVHVMAGEWALMLHGYAWGVYTEQGGPRGDDEAFVESMAMLQASRDFGATHLQLRSMLSLEPAMGAKGYPNLFATGETADGRTQLIDRQHPHDLFMELSARVDVDAGSGSLFVYGGPVAEPALGPPAFMHRPSATNQPLAPITHHWFDSTHISYGVVTVGYSAPRWQVEASTFRGREPDQHRWDIERPSLDSWSVRATWTPSPALAMQVSHGWLKSPEQLEPAPTRRGP